MTTSYLPYDPQQQLLLPHALQDWLPEGHLAYFISDTVDSLDLSAFHARYAGGGARNQPFHPAMMVKVLVYGYATGVFSSRKLARKLHEDVAFRVLAAGNYPAHRTLCDFRAFHLKELSHAQLVRSRNEGRFVIYSANFDTMNGLIGFLTENCCGGNVCSPTGACSLPEKMPV